MDLKELKEIIEIVTSKEEIEELELEQSGVRLRIKRIKRSSNHAAPRAQAPVRSGMTAADTVELTSAPPAAGSQQEEDLFYIKSPIVGTFYQAPSPGSESFVSVGDFVDKGSVVCIIEAMKLMNEIESDVAGEVVSVLVEDGQPVEYGEKLFAIRPR